MRKNTLFKSMLTAASLFILGSSAFTSCSSSSDPREDFDKALIDKDWNKAESLIPTIKIKNCGDYMGPELREKKYKEKLVIAKLDYFVTQKDKVDDFFAELAKMDFTQKARYSHEYYGARDDYRCNVKLEPGIYDKVRGIEIFHYRNFANEANSTYEKYLDKAITFQNDAVAKRLVSFYKEEPNFVENESSKNNYTDKWEGKSVVLKPRYCHLREYYNPRKEAAQKKYDEAKKDWQ